MGPRLFFARLHALKHAHYGAFIDVLSRYTLVVPVRTSVLLLGHSPAPLG